MPTNRATGSTSTTKAADKTTVTPTDGADAEVDERRELPATAHGVDVPEAQTSAVKNAKPGKVAVIHGVVTAEATTSAIENSQY